MDDIIKSIEEHHVSGDDLLARIKSLIHEGNIRRIIIKNEEGKTLMEIPLTLGLVGAALLPLWAALGAMAALAAKLTLVVEKAESGETPAAEPTA